MINYFIIIICLQSNFDLIYAINNAIHYITNLHYPNQQKTTSIKPTPQKVNRRLCEVFAIYVPLSQPLWVGHGTNTLAKFSL